MKGRGRKHRMFCEKCEHHTIFSLLSQDKCSLLKTDNKYLIENLQYLIMMELSV